MQHHAQRLPKGRAHEPPFHNLAARRAVAYALDRGALMNGRGGVFSGQVTCQILPPDFVAYQPYCPFTLGGGGDGTWRGPDFAKADDLVRKSGTRGAKVVLVVYDENRPLQTAGRRVVTLLDRLGYRASLRSYPLQDFFGVTTDPSNDFNAGIWDWGPGYPAASNFLANLAPCDPELEPFNVTGYCDPEIDTAIAAALEQQVTDPAGASDAWATIDRKVVDAAAYIPFGNNLRQDFVSRRVGNTLAHPVTGPLIAQMWVQ